MKNLLPFAALLLLLYACRPDGAPAQLQNAENALAASLSTMQKTHRTSLIAAKELVKRKENLRPMFYKAREIQPIASRFIRHCDSLLKLDAKIDLQQLHTQAQQTGEALFALIQQIKIESDSGKIKGVKIDPNFFDKLRSSLPLLHIDSSLLTESWSKEGQQFWLRRCQTDAQSSANMVFAFISDNMGWLDIGGGHIELVSIAESNTVFVGDTFRTNLMFDLFIYKILREDCQLLIDGELLKDGIKSWQPTRIGRHTHQAKALIIDPIDGDTQTLVQDFSFEVLPKK